MDELVEINELLKSVFGPESGDVVMMNSQGVVELETNDGAELLDFWARLQSSPVRRLLSIGAGEIKKTVGDGSTTYGIMATSIAVSVRRKMAEDSDLSFDGILAGIEEAWKVALPEDQPLPGAQPIIADMEWSGVVRGGLASKVSGDVEVLVDALLKASRRGCDRVNVQGVLSGNRRSCSVTSVSKGVIARRSNVYAGSGGLGGRLRPSLDGGGLMVVLDVALDDEALVTNVLGERSVTSLIVATSLDGRAGVIQGIQRRWKDAVVMTRARVKDLCLVSGAVMNERPGVFQSYREVSAGSQIWSVVEGGNGDLGGVLVEESSEEGLAGALRGCKDALGSLSSLRSDQWNLSIVPGGGTAEGCVMLLLNDVFIQTRDGKSASEAVGWEIVHSAFSEVARTLRGISPPRRGHALVDAEGSRRFIWNIAKVIGVRIAKELR